MKRSHGIKRRCRFCASIKWCYTFTDKETGESDSGLCSANCYHRTKRLMAKYWERKQREQNQQTNGSSSTCTGGNGTDMGSAQC
jgi:hypothetical protein